MRQFEKVQVNKVKRSAFDLSHERKTTFDMGKLVPVMCEEILPGDRFKVNFEAFLKTLPLVSPVMHRVNMYAHAFFVPNRLLLKPGKWEDFITGSNSGYTLPTFGPTTFAGGVNSYTTVAGDLFDHLNYGVQLGAGQTPIVQTQLALRAYHKIYNDFYRDQNQIAFDDVTGWADIIDGTTMDYRARFALKTRAWEKDYFTSALPTQQRGAAVQMPLGGYANVQGKNVRTGINTDTPIWKKSTDHSLPAQVSPSIDANGKFTASGILIAPEANLEADLTTATGTSITALRQAFALQRWYESSMRFGQRYIEQMLGLFGVKSRDSRLQRPEFLAGGKLPVIIGETLQTSRTDASQPPLGSYAGRAVSSGSLFGFDKTFDEHGLLMIIVSVIPKTSYSGYTQKLHDKLSRFDFAFPQLAHLSEQPVMVSELFNRQSSEAIFGYQPQYSEYRYAPDNVHGAFRTNQLKFWGLQREFSSAPGLNQSFVECNPPTWIWPVVNGSSDQLLLQSYAKITAIRPLPKFGTPL